MTELSRQPPVKFNVAAIESESRDFWRVILKYADEGDGPYLVDLSHKPRWDLQDASLESFRPCRMDIPESPGDSIIKNGVIINRMNRTQAAIWHITSEPMVLPSESAYSDVTEATVLLALFGPRVFSITEKLTSLDFLDPQKKAPFLLQGPLARVPCQIAVVQRSKRYDGCILFTCARGYGQSMVHAVLSAGTEYGLCPAGENRFSASFIQV